MATTKKKKTNDTFWEQLKKIDVLNLLLTSKNNSSFLNNLKSETEAVAAQFNLQRNDNMLKLIYQLLLYSVFGFFAKIIIKLFKF